MERQNLYHGRKIDDGGMTRYRYRYRLLPTHFRNKTLFLESMDIYVH